MKKTKLILSFLLIIVWGTIFSQTLVITDDSTYTTGNTSSVLDVKSSAKGFLAPRMLQSQRVAILSPAEGLLVYQTDGINGFYYYNNSVWIMIASGTTSNYLPLTGGTLTGKLNTVTSSTTNAGITLPHGVAPTTPVNGDLWTTTTGVFARINGSNVGPFGIGTGNGNLTSITATAPLTGGTITNTGSIGIAQANGYTNGFLSSSNWTTFNSKENAITAGTTSQYFRGDKTWQTLNSDNTPEGTTNLYYTSARVLNNILTGFSTTNSAILGTDNILQAFGKTQGQLNNLSTSSHAALTLGTTNGLSLIGQQLSLSLSSSTITGALSNTDWTTFNSKQSAGNYITALTGDVTALGPGSVVATIANNAVTNAKIANATIDITTKVTGTLPVANGGTGVTTSTGSGSVVLSNSPTLVTPTLGVAIATTINGLTPTALTAGFSVAGGTSSKTLTLNNTIGLSGTDNSTLNIGSGGILGNNAFSSTAYAPIASPTFTGTVTIPSPFSVGSTSITTTGAQLNYLNTAYGTTGTGYLVYSSSPSLTTPNIGAATGTNLSVSGQLTSTVATGTAPLVVTSTTPVANLSIGGSAATATTANTVTTNANLIGPITSVGNTTSIASQTGTGSTFVMSNSPTLTTPNIGVSTGTSLSVSGQLTSTVATGTAPLLVTSTTPVANLNIGGNAATATNVAGGLAGAIHYQTGAGFSGFSATTSTAGLPLLSGTSGIGQPTFGTLGVSGGGTGTTTLTGLIKGNGTTAFTAATSGIDYLAPYGSQIANTFYAAPNGSAGSPTFRAIVAGDIPSNITVSNYLPLAGGTMTGKVNTVASSISNAGLNLPHGATPTTPINGDIWTTTSGLYSRINGNTTGPYGIGTINSITATSPLTGGTISTSGSIGILQANSSTNGYLLNTDWATFNSKLSSTLTSGNIFVGNGSNISTSVALSGDATLANTGALALANSGVIAAQYGNNVGTIPVVTVDAKGRITTASNRTIVGGDIPTNIVVSNYLPLVGGTLTGKLKTVVSSTTTAGLNLPQGTAPTSPVNGDIWTTNNGIYSMINGSTIGPLNSASTAFIQNGNSFAAIARLGTNDNNDLAFETNNTEQMRILVSNGNVGINTITPAAKLDVNGSFKLGPNCPVLQGIIKTSVTITDNTAFSPAHSQTEIITITGAALNATVIVNPRTALPGELGIGYSYVSAANTVSINFTNTNAQTALGTVTFDITIIQ